MSDEVNKPLETPIDESCFQNEEEEDKKGTKIEPVEQDKGKIVQEGEEAGNLKCDVSSVASAVSDEEKKTHATDEKGEKPKDYRSGVVKGELPNAGDEFILVEDADSMEQHTAGPEGDEDMEDDDDDESYPMDEEEHQDEEYEEEHVPAEHRDIHDVVNEVLDTKLESFQAQIQKMFSMMQGGSMDGSSNKKVTVGGKSEPKEYVGADDDDDHDDDAADHQSDHGLDAGHPQQEEKDKQAWKEFLGRVRTFLDLSTTEGRSVLDETVGSSQKAVEYLPAEGIVRNSWQRIKGKSIRDMSRTWNQSTRHGYSWSQEDEEIYGSLPSTNPELISYLNHFADGRLFHGLSKEVKKHHADLRYMGMLFRYQQRVLSYASYFTAALRKNVPENEDIQEILKNLGQCLIDACDSSVYGCALTTRSIRRHYIDALGIFQSSKDPSYDALNLPLAKDYIFPQSQLNKVLRSFGINLHNPQMSNKVPTGIRGRGFKRPGLSRGFGRGMSRGMRGGGLSTTRGGYSGTTMGSTSFRGGYYQGGSKTARGRGGMSRGRGGQPRSRGSSMRGHSMPSSAGIVSRRNRSGSPQGGYGRGMKRSPDDIISPVSGKHRRAEGMDTVHGGYHSRHDKGGETSGPQVYGYSSGRSKSFHDTREKSHSPEKMTRPTYRYREGVVSYPSVVITPSSYYRSPSNRDFTSRASSSYKNEGWQ